MNYNNVNYNCIIDFFKSIGFYNEKYFELMKQNTIILKNDELENKAGFFPIYNNDELIDFNLYLPELVGLDNILIYIHEYGHALFPDDKSDIFPNILEVLFMKNYLNIPKKTDEIINRNIIDMEKSKSKIYKKEQNIKIEYLKCL